ncbi:MAG: GNAT family N-acetyltransferase [Clostridia bacterium]|nr:GNAT family N-acetyltransferase [Clostridia bacterium]
MTYYQDNEICIRPMIESDIAFFADAFLQLGWDDRQATLAVYFNEQNSGSRAVFVAEIGVEPVGYVTLLPCATEGPFADQGLPEIKDFNVLPPFRRRGIGNHLMDCAEALAKKQSEYVTLAVGLYAGYGSAQRMYVKRGYIPDGSGLWYGEKHLEPYEDCRNDDDLNLYFIKRLAACL